MQMSQTARAEQFCSKGQRNASPSKLYNTDLMFGGTFHIFFSGKKIYFIYGSNPELTIINDTQKDANGTMV